MLENISFLCSHSNSDFFEAQHFSFYSILKHILNNDFFTIHYYIPMSIANTYSGHSNNNL